MVEPLGQDLHRSLPLFWIVAQCNIEALKNVSLLELILSEGQVFCRRVEMTLLASWHDAHSFVNHHLSVLNALERLQVNTLV